MSSATGEILLTIANSTTSNGMIFAVDPVFGEIQWANSIFQTNLTNVTFQLGEMTGSATVAPDGMIYVGSPDGNLYSLFPDGMTNWVRPAGNFDSVVSTPAIGNNGLIYVTADEAEDNRAGSNVVTGVTAFNPSGTTNWFFVPQDLFYNNAGDVDGSPVVGADGTIYFVAEGSRLYALTAEGQLKWFLPLLGDCEPDSTPALASDGTIVVGSGSLSPNNVGSPYLYDVNPDGSLNWFFNVAQYGGGQLIVCSPTIDQNGVIYTGSATSSFYDNAIAYHLGCVFAINPDGSSKWTFTNETGDTISSPAVASDGTVYVGDFSGAYAIKNGVAAWSFSTGPIFGIPAILPDGSVLFSSEDGNLYCFWGNAPPATNAPWPMFQQNMNHTAQQTSVTVTNLASGAPFVFNGAYEVNSSFSFSMTGTPGSSNWNVYASTNLANTNWTQLATNLVMNATNGNNSFTDTNVVGVTNKFYIVGRSNYNSQAIGYVNQIVTRGTNLVADQLYQVDENILNAEFFSGVPLPMNTLNALFAVSNAWGLAQTNTAIFKWTGTGFVGDTNNGPTFPSWAGSGDLTLLPGSSVIMNNTNAPTFTNTFVGLIRNEQIFHIQPGTTYLSATVPVSGTVTTITGYPAQSGDIIQFWNTTSNRFISHTNISGIWSNGGLTNVLKVGEGFVLVTTHTFSWTNIWE